MQNGRQLKLWRDGAGLNQGKAAEMADIHQGAWSLIERGLKSPSLVQAVKIFILTGGEFSVDGWVPKAAISRARRAISAVDAI